MTEMKKRFYKRKADEIRKGRKVSFNNACDRVASALRKLSQELCMGARLN